MTVRSIGTQIEEDREQLSEIASELGGRRSAAAKADIVEAIVPQHRGATVSSDLRFLGAAAQDPVTKQRAATTSHLSSRGRPRWHRRRTGRRDDLIRRGVRELGPNAPRRGAQTRRAIFVDGHDRFRKPYRRVAAGKR